MQANGPVSTQGSLMTIRAQVSWLEQPDPRERRAQMLDGGIGTALKQAVERLVVVQKQTDFRGKSRAFRPFFQRLFRHFSGRDVTGDGLDTRHASLGKTQADVLSHPALLPALGHGGKFIVCARNLSRELFPVELLRLRARVFADQLEV